MNVWVQKSIEIANESNYLDKLQEIYPVSVNIQRVINTELISMITHAFENDDKEQLINLLLKLDKFPIKDPYVAFLRKKPEFISKNPLTVERIYISLKKIGLTKIIEGAVEAKEFNRQMGNLFSTWLPKLEYPSFSRDKFDSSKEGIVFLVGSGNELMNYLNSKYNCNLTKRPDLVAKVNDKVIAGEAKFLTDSGGHQNAQFEDAFKLLNNPCEDFIKIAVLDGVVWVKGKSKAYLTVSASEKNILSGLLLKDYLESLI